MARIYSAGAEYGHVISDGFSSTGTVVIDTNIVRSGRYSFKINSHSSNVSYLWTHVENVWTYHRIPFFIDRRPNSANVKLMTFFQGTVIMGHVEHRKSDGKLVGGGITNDGTQVSPVVPINTWSVLEVGLRSSGSALDVIYRLDGVVWYTQTISTSLDANRIRIGNTGTSNSAVQPVWYDDLVGNDDTGSIDNTWPVTEGGIIHALPVADSAIGANWLNGSGGVLVNAWDILNALPPQGVGDADAGNTLKQVRNATASATQPAAALDLQCQSYEEAGLPSDASVFSVRPVVAMSDHGTVTASDGDISIVSNPSQTPVNVATPSGQAGVYPSNWVVGRGERSILPSIDRSVRPVLRIARTSLTAARLLACHAAVQFEYAPVPLRGRGQIVGGIWT